MLLLTDILLKIPVFRLVAISKKNIPTAMVGILGKVAG